MVMLTAPGIYRIRNIKNGKIYIGQTNNLQHREACHRWLLRENHHHNSHLQASWNKHSECSFVFEEVLQCPIDDLFQKETEEIEKIPKELRYNKIVSNEPTARGFHKTLEQRINSSLSKGGSPGYAVHTKTGEMLTFNVPQEMADKNPKFNQQHIHECMNGKRRTHAGYQWFYVDSVRRQRVAETAVESLQEIISISPTGQEKKYFSIGLVKDDGFDPAAVYKCLQGKFSQHKHYTWKTADGLPYKGNPGRQRTPEAKAAIELGKQNGKKLNKGLKLTQEDTKEIRLFPSYQEAAVFLRVNPTMITYSLKNNPGKPYKGWYLEPQNTAK